MGRIMLEKVAPGLFTAMNAMKDFVSSGKLDENYLLLIDLRASMVNGCQFCIGMHTRNAIAAGMQMEKIQALRSWIGSPLFDDVEKAVLRFADEVTNINRNGVAESTYKTLREYFDEAEFVALLAQAVMINSWNRIVLTNKTSPAT